MDRKVVLQEFVSLDGYAAGPNDSVDFVPASTQGDDSFGRHQERFLDSIDTILLGRVTYELFSEHWPDVTSGPEKPFADKLNAIPKIVFSKTLDGAPWGQWKPAQVVLTDAAKTVAKLKQQSGKDMVIWGSISLAQSLMSEKLIDEYQLVICPIALGEGRPLFREPTMGMRLVKTESFARGAVIVAYAPAPAFRASPR
jgi:dihydrofolate reductase